MSTMSSLIRVSINHQLKVSMTPSRLIKQYENMKICKILDKATNYFSNNLSNQKLCYNLIDK